MNSSTIFSIIAIIIAVVAIGNSQLKEEYDDTAILEELQTIKENVIHEDEKIRADVTLLKESDNHTLDWLTEFYNVTNGNIKSLQQRVDKLEKPVIIPTPPPPPKPTPTPEPKGPCSANFDLRVVDLDGYLLTKDALSKKSPVFIKGTYPDIYKPIEYTVTDKDGNEVYHQTSQVAFDNVFRLAFNISADQPAGKYSVEVLIQGQSDCIDFTLE